MTHADTAINLVLGDRNASYGNPADDYAKTAKIWSGILHPILKRDITAQEAILMMVGLKLAREVHTHKADNVIDAHGYLLCYEWAVTGEKPTTGVTLTNRKAAENAYLDALAGIGTEAPK